MSPIRKPKPNKNKSRKKCNSQLAYLTNRIGWVNLTLALLLVAGVFIYLVQLSVSTTKGFAISELEKQVYLQEGEVRLAQQQINRLKSVEYISRGAEQLHMVAVGEVDFLQPLNSGVALGE